LRPEQPTSQGNSSSLGNSPGDSLDRAAVRHAAHELLRHSEQPLAVHVRGSCMTPLLADGARINIRPYSRYWPGDVVVIRSSAGFNAHRVLGYLPTLSGLRIVTRGDHSAAADRPRAVADVLGRVCGGECRAEVLRVPLRTRLFALIRLAGFVVGAALRGTRSGPASGGLPTG